MTLLTGTFLGCNNFPTEADQPAVIAAPTPESFSEIAAVLEQALGRRDILLADDLLTTSSILSLEQGGGQRTAATGRILEMPERFELVLSGSACYLIQTRTGRRWQLEQTNCIPAPP